MAVVTTLRYYYHLDTQLLIILPPIICLFSQHCHKTDSKLEKFDFTLKMSLGQNSFFCFLTNWQRLHREFNDPLVLSVLLSVFFQLDVSEGIHFKLKNATQNLSRRKRKIEEWGGRLDFNSVNFKLV